MALTVFCDTTSRVLIPRRRGASWLRNGHVEPIRHTAMTTLKVRNIAGREMNCLMPTPKAAHALIQGRFTAAKISAIIGAVTSTESAGAANIVMALIAMLQAFGFTH